ncbi:MAG: Maf family protein [Bdellovibrionaceae bacterium]|nr:Maf family protein [Pseudobdellovibrionaceae bacterium]
MRVILASQSEARQRLLAQLLGHRQFEVRPADLDERRLQRQIIDGEPLTLLLAKRVTRRLASAKANAVWQTVAQRSRVSTLVIGSDQLLYVPELQLIAGKPGSFARADRFLAMMAGRSAWLLTAVAVVARGGRPRVSLQAARLQFARISADERRAVLRADKPYNCAGSFKIEERGIALFDAVRSDDPTGIQGLPLMRLRRLLRDSGLSYI